MRLRRLTPVPPPPGGEAADAAPLLELRGVGKSYGAVRAVDDVSLTLRAGEVVGLCGHNGAGKSTLIKMLVGLVAPDAGTMLVDGREVRPRGTKEAQRLGISLVDQELSLVDALSVHDNIFLGGLDSPFVRRPRRTAARARELLEIVGLGHVDPFSSLDRHGIGERQLVEIARLLSRDARVFILDEPTAMLTESEIARVGAVVRAVAARGAAVVYVSHRLNEVLELCDRALVLRDGRLVAEHTIASLDRARLVRLIVGESGAADAPAHAADAAGGPANGGPAVSAAADPPPPVAAEEPLLTVRDLRVPRRVAGLSLEVRAGEVVGLAGQLGSGASETLRALGGLVDDASGEVAVGGAPLVLGAPARSRARGIVYSPNDRKHEGLFLTQDNARNLLALRHRSIVRGGLLVRQRAQRLARFLSGEIGLPAPRLGAAAASLSGGNQQKVLVGRALDLPDGRVLLFDDPTRGVDVGARAEIHALVRAAAAGGSAVVVATTEMEELLDLCDRIITVYAGRQVSSRPRSETDASRIFAEMTMGDVAQREASHA